MEAPLPSDGGDEDDDAIPCSPWLGEDGTRAEKTDASEGELVRWRRERSPTGPSPWGRPSSEPVRDIGRRLRHEATRRDESDRKLLAWRPPGVVRERKAASVCCVLAPPPFLTRRGSVDLRGTRRARGEDHTRDHGKLLFLPIPCPHDSKSRVKRGGQGGIAKLRYSPSDSDGGSKFCPRNARRRGASSPGK
ncbi:hypothetical protein THAOC_31483 [Thalassiosira oceanica]|uniref:Uncharacterized protein n=1 Tax=Thalassiosira oceanica TaxID=159749 RepID=K0R961_THAOC|nr:hypothetical protein THAOC_31483 [Thalassiosira oceanica]|eukprot:EJK49620.1 hypothetical protein THAOC_31483 [Thalassiosira oceanica]